MAFLSFCEKSIKNDVNNLNKNVLLLDFIFFLFFFATIIDEIISDLINYYYKCINDSYEVMPLYQL